MIYPIRLLYIPQDYWHLHGLFSTVLLHDVTITSSGVPTTGETYNLTCTVEANVPPTVQWLYCSNGSEVTNGSGITIGTQRTTVSTTTLTLSFNPLHTSHGGQYICQSMIGTPASTVNATRNMTVQGKYAIFSLKMADTLIVCTPQICICCLFNPLITNDTFWHRLTLATCYQLAQSVLEIGFLPAARKRDRGRWAGFSMGYHAHGIYLGWL